MWRSASNNLNRITNTIYKLRKITCTANVTWNQFAHTQSVPLRFLSSRVVVILHDFLTGHNGIAESRTFLIRWLCSGGLLCRAYGPFRCRTAVRIVFWWRWRWFDCSVHIQIGIMCVRTRRSESTTPLAIIPAYFLAIFHLCVCICVDLFINGKSDKLTLNGTRDMFYLIEAIYKMIARTDNEHPVPNTYHFDMLL